MRVNQPNLLGQNIADCKLLDGLHCMVTRRGARRQADALTPEDTFREGTGGPHRRQQRYHAARHRVPGEACENPYPMDSQKERRKLILTNKDYAGRKLRDLKTLRTDGVIISTFPGWGSPLSPTGDTTLERNDVLTVVGSPENLTKYGEKIGHRSQDIARRTSFPGIPACPLGIILGLVNFSLGNGMGISLGIAGSR